MSDLIYILLKVWKWEVESGGIFVKINWFIVGFIYDKELL